MGAKLGIGICSLGLGTTPSQMYSSNCKRREKRSALVTGGYTECIEARFKRNDRKKYYLLKK
jgi:hypothetical protein